MSSHSGNMSVLYKKSNNVPALYDNNNIPVLSASNNNSTVLSKNINSMPLLSAQSAYLNNMQLLYDKMCQYMPIVIILCK